MSQSLPDDRGGADAVQHLVRTVLRGRNSASDRCEAASVLAALGPHARSAVPYLVRSLRDHDYDVREAACDALTTIAARDPSAIDARLLLAPMTHHHGRFLAIHVLSKLPSEAVRPIAGTLRSLPDRPWSGTIRPFLTALFDFRGTWLFGHYSDDREFERGVSSLLCKIREP